MNQDLNIKLLRKVQKAILKYHNQFDMAAWFEQSNFIGAKPGRCGTAACLAGWAVTLSVTKDASPKKAEAWSNKKNVMVGYEAMDLLGLNYNQRNALFFSNEWPPPFRMAYNNASTTKEAAKAASDRIDYLIKTGK